MNFKIIIFLAFLSLSSTQDIDVCNRNTTLKEVPGGILPHVLHFLAGYSTKFFGCREVTVPKSSIKFYLYTRKNSTNPILLNTENLHEIDPKKKLIFQIHGWLCNSQDGGMLLMKDAYLLRYNANVIILDWSDLGINLYPESVCSIRPAARIFGNFICTMNKLRNVTIESIHLVGHSLGAHFAGISSQYIRQVCGKTIGRITGLDPAGPYFQQVSINDRLDASDAYMVDVIHTNMGFAGYYGSLGTIDFYPNCGIIQPGCLSLSNLTRMPNFQDIHLSLVSCNHYRSVLFMMESIASPKFIARRCDLCPGLPGLCAAHMLPTSDQILMGEDCPSKAPGSKYYLTTNSQKPYARGRDKN